MLIKIVKKSIEYFNVKYCTVHVVSFVRSRDRFSTINWRKEGNYLKKSNLYLYAKNVPNIIICPELALT